MNEITLSSDLNVITAEINSYKQVAGQAIFEIGRRLKHVKENDLVHGEFGKWLESIDLNHRVANQMMKVAEELPNSSTYSKLSARALYEIATLPEEEREKEHTLSSGETKTVDEMTVRELQEVKRKLREAEQDKEKLAKLLTEERNKQPIEKEVIKEVIPKHVKLENLQLQKEVEAHKEQLKRVEQENLSLQKKLQSDEITKTDFENMKRNIEQLSVKRNNLQQDIEDIEEITKFIVKIDELKTEAFAPIAYSKSVRRQKGNSALMKRLDETVSLVEDWCSELRKIMNIENQIIDVEAVE